MSDLTSNGHHAFWLILLMLAVVCGCAKVGAIVDKSPDFTINFDAKAVEDALEKVIWEGIEPGMKQAGRAAYRKSWVRSLKCFSIDLYEFDGTKLTEKKEIPENLLFDFLMYQTSVEIMMDSAAQTDCLRQLSALIKEYGYEAVKENLTIEGIHSTRTHLRDLDWSDMYKRNKRGQVQ